MSVIAVCGLAIEARIAAGSSVRTVVGGGNAQQLSVALEREIERGARAIISFGIAGGLAEYLSAGRCVVARKIITSSATWPVHRAWSTAIAGRLPGALSADIAGVDAIVINTQAKASLQRATGAAIVDTESHIAARIAANHRLPFAAFRVVADSARRTLPPAAHAALRHDGKINHRAVLTSLARAPLQFGSLARTAIDARIAFRALSRGRRRLGPSLGFADFDELVQHVL